MRWIATLLLVASFAACAGENTVTGDRRNVGVVTVVFTAAPARAQVGQPVRLTFRVSNNGGKVEHLTSPSAKLYDFWAKQRGREVWRWSKDMSFVQAVTTTDVESQSSKTYTEIWRPTNAGRITVYGELQSSGFTGPMTGTVMVR